MTSMHAYRTHNCGALRASDTGATVRLSGWIHRKRDHGGLVFIDLRDHHGLTQLALQKQPLEAFIDALYLRLLTRLPDAGERAAAVALLGPGFAEREVKHPPAAGGKRVRPKFVTWSNHLDGPANALAQELEAGARRGDPPTLRLEADWRERLEDLLWQTLNRPEWLFIR